MTYDQVILADPDLISYYKMGDAGPGIADSGPANVSGTQFGSPTYGRPTLIVAGLDGSIGFDGATDFFGLGQAAAQNIGNAFTYHAWFEFGGAPGPFGGDHCIAGASGAGLVGLKWFMQLQSTSTGVTFGMVDTAVNAFVGTFGSGVDSGIHMATLTYSLANGGSAYIDGVQLATNLMQFGFPIRPFQPGDDMAIGVVDPTGAPERRFLGDMDAHSLHGREWSAAEVLDLYNIGAGLAVVVTMDIDVAVALTPDQSKEVHLQA